MRLGIFDSGLGGLTVLQKVRACLPTADVVYLADQAHVPYGDRTHEELRALLAANVRYLQELPVDAIVMGCNTSCAVAAKFGWPATDIPIFDLIESAAESVAQAGVSRVGVIATKATTLSGAYGRAIRRATPSIAVQEVAAPALVPLVEEGKLDGDEPREAVVAACAQFSLPLDAVVLACTHYPLLEAHFAAALGPSVKRIDPADAQAQRAATFARSKSRGSARTRYLTTGSLESFASSLAALGITLGPGDEVAALHATGTRASYINAKAR